MGGGGRGLPRSDRRVLVRAVEVLVLDRAGRGLPRSDRRAFVYPIMGLLFEEPPHNGFLTFG